MNELQVRLQIDELVLHGFEGADGAAIAQALRERLGELIRVEGLPVQLRTASDNLQLHSPQIDAPSHVDTTGTGHRIADAIYRGLR